MIVSQNSARKPVKDHPFVTKLDRSIRLDGTDMAALERLLSRRVVVKKAKDIIIEGYEHRTLHIVESGFAIRYKLLHSGKRQIATWCCRAISSVFQRPSTNTRSSRSPPSAR